MSAATPTLTWEQYQQLPPDQRRRPLSAAEYAALSPSQLQQGGLADSSDGAPANFAGPVFPNPDHVQPQLDTDSAIPATRLPNGVEFQKGTYQGGAQGDLSNPAATQAIPAMGREVGADFSPGQSKSGNSVSTVPIFAPDGTLGDVPADQLAAAVKAGAKPGIHVTGPDGSPGVIPADRTMDAVKAGAKIVPIEDQPVQHPGFWASLGADLGGMLHPSGLNPYPGMGMDEKAAAAGQAYEQDQARKKAGYSTPYRALAPVAQSVGVNVPGMEQSAAEGDVAGVAGHAAAPAVVLGTGEALAHGAPALADAAKSAAESRAGRTIVKTALDAATDFPVIRKLAKLKENYEATAPGAQPELDATGENKPFAGGPDEPPPQKVLDATGENKPFAGGMDEYTPPKASVKTAPAKPAPRTVVIDPESGAPEFSDVVAQKQSAAQTTPQPKSAPAAASQTTDPILARLQDNASRIQAEESSAKTSSPAEDDLTDILQKSVDQAKAGRAAKDAGKTIEVPGQGEVPRFVYRARTVGEEGVPATDVAAHATSDFDQAMKFAEPGQRGADWGQVVRIDLSKLKPEDFSVRQHPDGMSWVKFKRGLSEDEVTPFAGQMASAE